MAQSNISRHSDSPASTVCYLLLAHHKFDLLQRIIERLAGPGVGFVIHFDRKVSARAIEEFKRNLTPKAQLVAYSRRERSRWAGYAQAVAIMRVVQAALTKLPAFDRYVLASGQCYPLASPEKIATFFAQHPTTEFIEARPLDTATKALGWWSPYYCFRLYHVWLGKRRRYVPWLRKAQPVIPIYQGSTWWALTRAAMEHVRHEFENNHRLRRQMSTSIFVDEAYIHSLLMASPLAANVVRRNVTYADFSKTHLTGPHPTILTSADLATIVASGKLLARKVDPHIDAALLDQLDQHIAA